MPATTNERYCIDDLVLDVAAASVSRGGAPLQLSRLSFDLLLELARRHPDVVRSEELKQRLWPDVVVTEENLTQRVSLLRRTLGDSPKGKRYVETVRGFGYRLMGRVERLGDAGARERSARADLRAGRRLGLALLVVLASATWLAWWLAAEPKQRPVSRVLVAPLAVEGSADAALGRVLADWIVQGLATDGPLEVVPSVEALSLWRGRDPDPVALARQIRARILLTGRVIHGPSGYRAEVQVADLAAHDTLESVAIEAVGVEELLARTRERASAAVLARTHRRLRSLGRLSAAPPDMETYRSYVAALERHVARDFGGALEAVAAAVDREPAFAPALILAAQSSFALGRLERVEALVRRLEPQRARLPTLDRLAVESLERQCRGDLEGAQRAAAAGARIAPRSHWSFEAGRLALATGRPHEAARILRSIEVDGGPLEGFLPYWWYRTEAEHVIGDHGRERAAAAAARQRHPLDLAVVLLEVRALAALGAADEIDALLATAVAWPSGGRAVDVEMADVLLAGALELDAHAQPVRGAALASRAADLLGAGPVLDSRLPLAAHLAGRRGPAQAAARQLASRDPASPALLGQWLALGAAAVPAAEWEAGRRRLASDPRTRRFGLGDYWIAAGWAARGRPGPALAALERAYASGRSYSWPARHPHADPWLRALRGEPGFERLVTPRDDPGRPWAIAWLQSARDSN